MEINDEIFREYDIRGKYNIDYDDRFAFLLGRAFVIFSQKYINKPLKIALGKDARHSSTPLLNSVAEGINFEGADALDLGLVTSPVSYFSNFHDKEITGAVMITGSHNPPEYNGFKITLAQKTLTSEEIQELKKIVHSLKEDGVKEKGSFKPYDIITPYIERLGKEFSHLKDLPFVVDCGNGAAGSVVRKAFSACNLNPHILFEEPDGDFPNHHPDPTLEPNLTDIKKVLSDSNYKLGIAYDGDADRIVVITPKGRTVYADELMALYSKDVLREHPGSKIIGDVKCSDEFYKLLEKWGAKPIMWKTGHSLIKKKVKDEGSPFGGEFSGHIFFNDRYYGFDDAIYCSLRLIEIVQKHEDKTLDQLLEFYPKTFSSPEIRIEVGEKEKHELVELYKNKIKSWSKSTNELDGVRATFETGWALVRCSNTQPSITLRFESTNEKDLDKIIEISSEILKLDLKSYT
jgi:phosphomannomutase/phosphomannomutase/phosphoglucomutase